MDNQVLFQIKEWLIPESINDLRAIACQIWSYKYLPTDSSLDHEAFLLLMDGDNLLRFNYDISDMDTATKALDELRTIKTTIIALMREIKIIRDQFPEESE